MLVKRQYLCRFTSPRFCEHFYEMSQESGHYPIMQKLDKTIIKHIPDFLDYCEVEKGLSNRTQENYQRYLQKFILWLKKTGKEALLPQELTADDIWAYRLYLSRFQDKRGLCLKTTILSP